MLYIKDYFVLFGRSWIFLNIDLLLWGARGSEFESRRPDQIKEPAFAGFFNFIY